MVVHMDRPTSLIHRHLREHGELACAYWSPAHNSVVVDCTARSAGPAELPDVWTRVAEAGGSTGFDPAPIYGEPVPGQFGAVILQPERIRVVQAEKLPSGGPYLTWRRTHQTRTTMAFI